MSDDDGMDFSTRVRVVRCAWVPMAMSQHARQ
jgi:hypothetical protein